MLRQQRVVIDNISPQIECGTFFVKRVVGEILQVTADVLGDGHDVIQCELLFRHEGEKTFKTVIFKDNGLYIFFN